MCGASLDAWANGEYGFSAIGSWSYSREWVWDLRTILLQVTELSAGLHSRNLMSGI